jgi:HEAT repeat protein
MGYGCVITLSCCVLLQIQAPISNPDDPVNALKADDAKARDRAATAIRNDHKRLVDSLITIAASDSGESDAAKKAASMDAKYLAILLLGELRSEEAISILCKNLQFKNPRVRDDNFRVQYIGDLYPATEALGKVGPAAVNPVIGLLGAYQSDDGLGRKLCAFVLRKALGGEQSVKARVEQAIQEAKDEKVRKNLQESLRYFDPPEAR